MEHFKTDVQFSFHQLQTTGHLHNDIDGDELLLVSTLNFDSVSVAIALDAAVMTTFVFVSVTAIAATAVAVAVAVVSVAPAGAAVNAADVVTLTVAVEYL